MASHWALQYLPDVVTHEQIGCAHFSVLGESICFLLASDHEGMIQAVILVLGRNMLLYKKEHISKSVKCAEVAKGLPKPEVGENIHLRGHSQAGGAPFLKFFLSAHVHCIKPLQQVDVGLWRWLFRVANPSRFSKGLVS
jgi:hypothetical protein